MSSEKMENKRDKILALTLTVLIGVLMVVTLMFTYVTPASAFLPQASDVEEQEIFFADIEYNEIQTNPTPSVNNEPASAATSEDGGVDMTEAAGESVPDIVAENVSKPENQKVVKPEETTPPGPTKEEIEQEKRAAIAAKIGKTTGLKASENQAGGSSTDGNAATGDNPTSSGLGLDGRKLQNHPDPGIKNAVGKVWIKVTVNAAGNVTSADFVRSSGFGSREAEVREACLAASRLLRYSSDSAKPSQSGTICWNIK